MIITGRPGVGKTYFCAAILEFILPKVSSFRCWNERKLHERLREVISSGTAANGYTAELHYCCDDDFLIIDDVGSGGHTQWREEVLTELVDYRYSNRLATIFTSNLSRREFESTYHPRVASRLFAKENLIVDFSQLPDQREVGN